MVVTGCDEIGLYLFSSVVSVSHTTEAVDPDVALGGGVALGDGRDGVPLGGVEWDGALGANDEEHNCDTFSVGRFWFKSFSVCFESPLFMVSTRSRL